MFAKLTAISLLSFSLIACSSNESIQLSEQSVSAFHQQFNERQFKYIYDHSSTTLKEHTTEVELTEFLEGVHNKLGKLKSTEQQQWNVTKNIGKPTSITLTYSSTFEKGQAEEQFIFYQENEKNLLAGYHINSKDLVIR